MLQQRERLSYEIDGTVFKVDDIALQQRLGFVIRAPHGINAYMLSTQEGVTSIEDVEFQVSRTGDMGVTMQNSVSSSNSFLNSCLAA